MKYFLICILIISIFSSFKTGEGTAILTCKSESRRSLFNAVLDEAVFLRTAELTIDNSTMSFSATDEGHIIFDADDKVFTMYLESTTPDKKTKFLRLWAIPSSFKKIFSEDGPGSQFHHIYEFRARLESTEPRKGKEYNTPTIELVCTLDYQL